MEMFVFSGSDRVVISGCDASDVTQYACEDAYDSVVSTKWAKNGNAVGSWIKVYTLYLHNHTLMFVCVFHK